MPKKSAHEVVNPFTDKFMTIWQLWKDYKKESFGFTYKSATSEQMAIIQLSDLCGGDESTAISAIKQSIANQWKGLFALKSIKHEQKQPIDHASARKSLNDALSQRFGNGGSAGNERGHQAL